MNKLQVERIMGRRADIQQSRKGAVPDLTRQEEDNGLVFSSLQSQTKQALVHSCLVIARVLDCDVNRRDETSAGYI